MPSITIGFVPRDRFCRAAEALQRIFDYTHLPFNLVVVDCDFPPVYRQQMEKVLKGRSNVKHIYATQEITSNAARNLVLLENTDDFLCLIENDVMVEEGWLPALVAACESHTADVAAPLILEPQGSWDKVHFDDRLGQIRRIPEPDGPRIEIVPRSTPKELDRNAERRSVEFIEMHCALFRRNVFDRIGPFDGTQRGSRAEVDLSLALYSANVPVVLEPKSRVTFCPPPPVFPEEKDFYLRYWNLDQAIRDHACIKERWRLVDCPSAIGFVKGRLRIPEEPDPSIQIRRYAELLETTKLATQELSEIVPSGQTLILVDDSQWRAKELARDRRAIPFMERNGQYWGSPPDDQTAIREFERLRLSGANFIAFGSPAFWWLDNYPGLHRHLRSRFPCVLENQRLVIFDLRGA